MEDGNLHAWLDWLSAVSTEIRPCVAFLVWLRIEQAFEFDLRGNVTKLLLTFSEYLMRVLDCSENIISACAATFACEVCALGVRRLFIQMASHLEEEVTSYEKQACMNDGSNLVLACSIRRLSVLWEAPSRAWQIGVKDAS